MNLDVSNRDKFGFLKGRFDQGWLSYPVEVLADVEPFLFPCANCKRIVFHVAAEQHAGIVLRVLFIGNPLASTGRTVSALCNECTTINTKLTDEMVEKLRKGVIPVQFCNLYHQVRGPDQPSPYSPEAIKALVESVPAEQAVARRGVSLVLRYYALETDKEAQKQSLCWACGIRVTPQQLKPAGFFAVFVAPSPLPHTCPKCRKEVRAPAL